MLHPSRFCSALKQHSDLWGAAGRKHKGSTLRVSSFPHCSGNKPQTACYPSGSVSCHGRTSCLWLYVQGCCSAELKRHWKTESGSLIRLLLFRNTAEGFFFLTTFNINTILKMSLLFFLQNLPGFSDSMLANPSAGAKGSSLTFFIVWKKQTVTSQCEKLP